MSLFPRYSSQLVHCYTLRPQVCRVESKWRLFSTTAKKMCEICSSFELHCSIASKLSAVATLGIFTTLYTYSPDHRIKLHYEGGIFILKLYSVLKIFTNEASHRESWFKSGGSELHCRIWSTNVSSQGNISGPETRNRNLKESVVAEIVENYCVPA